MIYANKWYGKKGGRGKGKGIGRMKKIKSYTDLPAAGRVAQRVNKE